MHAMLMTVHVLLVLCSTLLTALPNAASLPCLPSFTLNLLLANRVRRRVLVLVPAHALVDDGERRVGHEVAHVVPARAEEGVAQNDVVDLVQRRVVDDVAVDEEEDGQVDLLARADLLLLEAEALDLGKVRRDLGSARGSRAERRGRGRGGSGGRTG